MAFIETWIDKVDGKDYVEAGDVNLLAQGVKEAFAKIPTKVGELTNDSGYITSTVQNVESINYLNPLESNKVYRITTGSAQIVGLPVADSNIQNQILIYLNATAAIDIVWGEDVVFVNDEIPTIGIGHYRIIFEFNPILAKWVVGVIQDGAVN